MVNSTQKGALYGSVIPGIGTALGAGIGSLFGGGGGGGPFVSGGGDETAYATNEFQKLFGRAHREDELAQLVPSYIGADQHIPNVAGGNAQVAAYYQQQQNTPQAIYQKQQQQYLQEAPKYADQVNQQFQSLLGRDATADEKNHFGALIASGQDPYQVQQALQQTQEYQNTANTKFQNQLQNQLQGSNSTYFNQYIMPDIQARAAQSGRSLDASGVNSQLANAALQQNQGLQNFLAQTTAQNYQNSTANASNQYNNLMSQQYGLQNANVSSGLANQAANQQYNQGLNMYQLQQQSYNNYLNQYGKRNSGLGGAIGTVAGGALGAFGGPQGAALGASLGGSVGSAFGGGSYGQGYQPPTYEGISNLPKTWAGL
jgi:hypothetical protein